MVNGLYTIQAKANDLHFVAMMDRAVAESWMMDEPSLDEITPPGIESSCQRTEDRG